MRIGCEKFIERVSDDMLNIDEVRELVLRDLTQSLAHSLPAIMGKHNMIEYRDSYTGLYVKFDVDVLNHADYLIMKAKADAFDSYMIAKRGDENDR